MCIGEFERGDVSIISPSCANDKKKKDFLSEIELTYRTSSMYTKKNGLPGDIFMRFSTKRKRDLILQKTADHALKAKDQAIRLLKDILFAEKQKRKLYKLLSSLLIKKNISFRCLTLERLSFNIKGNYFKITSPENLKAFMDKQEKEFEELQIPRMEGHQEEKEFNQSSKEEETEGKNQLEGATAAIDKR